MAAGPLFGTSRVQIPQKGVQQLRELHTARFQAAGPLFGVSRVQIFQKGLPSHEVQKGAGPLFALSEVRILPKRGPAAPKR